MLGPLSRQQQDEWQTQQRGDSASDKGQAQAEQIPYRAQHHEFHPGQHHEPGPTQQHKPASAAVYHELARADDDDLYVPG